MNGSYNPPSPETVHRILDLVEARQPLPSYSQFSSALQMARMLEDFGWKDVHTSCKDILSEVQDGDDYLWTLEQFQVLFPEELREPQRWQSSDYAWHKLLSVLFEEDDEFERIGKERVEAYVQRSRTLSEMLARYERCKAVLPTSFLRMKNQDWFDVLALDLARLDEATMQVHPNLEERILSARSLQEVREITDRLARLNVHRIPFDPYRRMEMTDHLRSLPGGRLPGLT